MSTSNEKFTAIANKIRSYTGENALIAPNDFADKIDDVYEAGQASGGGGETGDERWVYHGERPAHWLRLPDYDKMGNALYALVFFDKRLIEKNKCLTLYYLLNSPYSGNVSLDFGYTDSTGNFVTVFSDSSIKQNTGSGITYYVKNWYNSIPNDSKYIIDENIKQIILRLSMADDKDFSSSAIGTNIFCIKDVAVNTNIYTGISDLNLGLGYFTNCGDYLYIKNYSKYAKLSYFKYIDASPNNPTDIFYFPSTEKLVEFKFPAGTDSYGCPAGDARVISGTNNGIQSCNSLINLKINLTNYTKSDTSRIFYGASSTADYLTSLTSLIFTNCSHLTSYGYNLGLANTNLNSDAVSDFFDSIFDISTTTARTIYLNNSTAALNGDLTAEIIAKATAKGWTVVTK